MKIRYVSRFKAAHLYQKRSLSYPIEIVSGYLDRVWYHVIEGRC